MLTTILLLTNYLKVFRPQLAFPGWAWPTLIFSRVGSCPPCPPRAGAHDILTQIDIIVLDFPIFPALGNGGAQSVDFESENRQKLVFFRPSNLLGGTYEHPMGDKLFQNIYRVVWQGSRKSAQGRRKIGGRKKTK